MGAKDDFHLVPRVLQYFIESDFTAALCLFPQNGWLDNASSVTWGILRNIPFVPLLGMLMLPKTVCYILLIFTFYAAVVRDQESVAIAQ